MGFFEALGVSSTNQSERAYQASTRPSSESTTELSVQTGQKTGDAANASYENSTLPSANSSSEVSAASSAKTAETSLWSYDESTVPSAGRLKNSTIWSGEMSSYLGKNSSAGTSYIGGITGEAAIWTWKNSTVPLAKGSTGKSQASFEYTRETGGQSTQYSGKMGNFTKELGVQSADFSKTTGNGLTDFSAESGRGSLETSRNTDQFSARTVKQTSFSEEATQLNPYYGETLLKEAYAGQGPNLRFYAFKWRVSSSRLAWSIRQTQPENPNKQELSQVLLKAHRLLRRNQFPQ